MEKATFGAGCFWGVEKIFMTIKGVISTRVGYCGGQLENPTYEQVCTGTTGHAEVLEITFDMNQVSYPELLSVFFRLHDPTQINRQGNDIGTQYRSAIFYHTEDQKIQAEQEKSIFDASNAFNKPSATEITEVSHFFVAETYHQDYLTKNPQGYMCHILRPKY